MKGDLQLSRQTAWEGRGGMPAPGDGVSGVLAGGGSVLPEQESLLVGELEDGLCGRQVGLWLPEKADLADCVRNVAPFY